MNKTPPFLYNTNTIISWNPRSMCLYTHPGKMASLIDLIGKHNPLAVCLQDCGSHFFKLKGYQHSHFIQHQTKATKSFVAFKEGVIYKSIEDGSSSNATWQVYEVKNPDRDNTPAFILINLYISSQLTLPDWALIDTLLGKYEDSRTIVTGDLNAESPCWSSLNTDNLGQFNTNGTNLDKSLFYHDFHCVNTGKHTRVPDFLNGRHTSIDLTLVSGMFGVDNIRWDVHSDACGSDHLPQIIVLNEKVTFETDQHIKLKFKTDIADPFIYRASFKTSESDSLKFGNAVGGDSIDGMTVRITDHIMTAAYEGIPNNSKKLNKTFKHPPPILKNNAWFNDRCKKAKSDRNFWQRKYYEVGTHEVHIKYKRASAIFRNIVKSAKKHSEQEFVDSINLKSNSRDAWGHINAIRCSSKKSSIKVAPLSGDIDNPELLSTDPKEKANILAVRYRTVSHDCSLNNEFIIKRTAFVNSDEGRQLLLKQQIDIDPDDAFDRPLTLKELNRQLNKRKTRSAAGPDNVTYWMIRESPQYVKEAILELFNKIWDDGSLPSAFKSAHVLPIKKPNKDPSSPASYRPIALTSHLGKLLEAIINDRLKRYLDLNGILTNTQTGFRNHKETLEPLVRLESDIRKAWEQNKVLCAVFLDLSAAFDTAQHIYILQNLAAYGVKGRMYNYIRDFMNDRTFQVRVGSALSDPENQFNGVPQGAVISPTLFLISVNEISKLVSQSTMTAQYADDSALWRSFYRYEKGFDTLNLKHEQDIMSEETNKVIKGLQDLGYKVNTSKTQAVLFSKGRDPEYNLKLGDSNVTTQKQAKYLGVTLDKKLTFKQHLADRRKGGKSVINLLYTLRKGELFKQHPNLLRTVAKSLLNSTVLYGMELFGRPEYIDKQGVRLTKAVLRRARRIYTNTISTTNGECIDALSGELPFESLCQVALGGLWSRKAGQEDSLLAPLFNNKPKTCWPKYAERGVVRSIHQMLDCFEVKSNQVAPIPKVSYGGRIVPKIDLSLTSRIKKKENTSEYMRETSNKHINDKYEKYFKMYTDASKESNPGQPEKVGVGVYSERLVSKSLKIELSESIRIKERLTDDVAIATAELKALHIALQVLLDLPKATNDLCNGISVVICSDSLSALQELQANSPSREDLVLDIYNTLEELLYNHNIAPTFLWIPSHCGIEGNEEADSLAKQASEKEEVNSHIKLGPSELKCILTKKSIEGANSFWSEHLNSGIGSVAHMRAIVPKPFTAKIPLGKKFIKRNRLLVNRPAFYALRDERCEICGKEQTPEHMIMHCVRLNTQRSYLEKSFRREGVPFSLNNILNPNPPTGLLYPILKYIDSIDLVESI